MDNKNNSNLDKRIEVALKKNLSSISASDDLIARTLANIDKAKMGSVVTPLQKKKKKVPVALISGIAAACLAVAGAVFVFTNNSNKTASFKSEHALTDNASTKSEKIHLVDDNSIVADYAAAEAMDDSDCFYEETDDVIIIYDSPYSNFDTSALTSLGASSNFNLVNSNTMSSIRARISGYTEVLFCSKTVFNPYYTGGYRYSFADYIQNEIVSTSINKPDNDMKDLKMLAKAAPKAPRR